MQCLPVRVRILNCDDGTRKKMFAKHCSRIPALCDKDLCVVFTHGTYSESVFPNPSGDRRATIPPTGYESLLGGPHALSLLRNELKRRIKRLVYAVEISSSR